MVLCSSCGCTLKSYVNKVDLSWELRNKPFIKKEKIIWNGKIDLAVVGLGLTYLPHGSGLQKVDVAGQIHSKEIILMLQLFHWSHFILDSTASEKQNKKTNNNIETINHHFCIKMKLKEKIVCSYFAFFPPTYAYCSTSLTCLPVTLLFIFPIYESTEP